MGEDRRDPVSEIEDGIVRGERLKAFKKSAGIEDIQQVTASEKTSVDLAGIFKSQTDLLTHSLDKIEDMRKTNQQAGTDPYLQHLEGDLKAMQEKMNAPGQDPVEALMQSTQRLQTFTQLMKDHLGIPSGTQVAPSDMPRLIELEQLKQDGEERRRQWDAQMEAQRRQWDKEDRRWMEEFRLKRMEFAENRQTRSHAVSALEDLAGSVVDGIDTDRGGGETVGGPGRVRKPKSFKCGDCGAVVQVSSPDALEAMCDSCGAIFDLVKQTESETTPAGA